MYESPITAIVNEICSDIEKKEDKYIMECVRNVGITVDKDELVKALAYDRNQYDKGFADGFDDGYDDGYKEGLNKVCKDFQKVIEIVFSNEYPEDKEDELVDLLQEYRKENN